LEVFLQVEPASVLREQSTQRVKRYLSRIARISPLFLLCVVIPTVISTVYFGIIASDVYISESRFIVRSSQRQAVSSFGSFLQNVGVSRAQDDAYSVHDFMMSRDALHRLNDQLGVAKSFSAPGIDMFNRFDPLGTDGSFEALYKYYGKQVSIDADSSSNISVLRVKAFNPQVAFRTNEALLEMGEQLINRLNERSRRDTVRFSEAEVASAAARANAASLALSKYRNQNGVFDPDRQSGLQLQQISKMQDELIATKATLAQVTTLTPDNPQIGALRKRIDTLQGAIDAAMGQVAGSGASLTSKAADYDRLLLEREFAAKQLTTALASLEQAKSDAQRKQLYLDRIVEPNKPDSALEPRRLRAILTTFLLGLVVMGMASLLIAGAREHKD
jgi:capsular polysaccharide transport system permease protein